MNINDYLIAQAGKNWTQLLSYWTPPLPQALSLWLVNRCGDAFVILDNGAIHQLDVGGGKLVRVADSREDFARQLDANAQAWLRIGLVDACRAAGMTLGPQQCYGLKVPPLLGGKYEVANVKPTDLLVYYSYQAYIHKQEDVYWIAPGQR